MSNAPTVSLIIVSRNRQAGLRRVVSALRFQTFTGFELIVVADAPDAGFLDDLPHSEAITYVPFDEPNISAARNLGLEQAQGEIVAFCDDDAIPDPNWLENLVQPFSQPEVVSAGGFVRGRNGIGYQWTALLCDRLGEDHPLELDGVADYAVVRPDEGRFAKLQGTNCAFRRQALLQLGGFDPGYRFFLDETDVCLRLAQAGHASAFVPMAQVHHGFEASDNRSADRVPRSLFAIGASKTRFLLRHGAGLDTAGSVQRLIDDQKARLIRLMVEGKIEPRDVSRLMQTLHAGLEEPQDLTDLPPIAPKDRCFRRFGHATPSRIVGVAGSSLSRKRVMQEARKNAAQGHATLVILFSLTSFFHSRMYDGRGFWVQTGGLFGRSERTDTIMKVWTIKSRAVREFTRTASVFPVSEIHIIKMFRNFVLQMTKSESS